MNWFSAVGNWWHHTTSTRREFTWGSFLRRVGVLVLKWVGVALTLGIGPILISPKFAAADHPFTYFLAALRGENISLSSFMGLSVLIVVLNELRVYWQETPQKPSEESIDMLILNMHSAAIEEIYNTDGEHADPIKSLLQRIEYCVVAIIGEKATRASVSSNLMAIRSEGTREPYLWLVRWGNQLSERVVLGLELDPRLPGAPAAFLQQRVVYVSDTQAAEYAEHFVNKQYRSIISIPVYALNADRKLCGVINIDATRADLFQSEEYIAAEIMPRLKPLVNLIAAQWERV